MKILITGGSGFLGQYLNIYLSKNYELLTIFNEHPGNCTSYNSAKVDITDKQSLQDCFKSFKPDIVIHTAAVTSTLTELPAKVIYDINVNSTGYIAAQCAAYNCRLIYTSTDLVYAGYRGSMLKEDAKLVPASLYAETKLMGEEKIRQSCKNYVILRTALLFGFGLNHSVTHFHKMYTALSKGKKVKLFTDQFRTPLAVNEAVKYIEEFCRLQSVNGEVFNFGGPERLSRFQLGEMLCRSAGFDKSLLIPIKMNDIPGYPAVEDVSMNTDKLVNLKIQQKDLYSSISEIVQNFRTARKFN